MKNPLSLNVRHVFRTNKEGLIFIIGTPILALVTFYIKDVRIDLGVLIIIFGFTLLLSVPSIYSFVTFYDINKNTKITVDNDDKKILIKDKNGIYEYKFSDITHVDRVISIYYKNRLDNKGRWPAPWTGYGFIRLTFDDGEKYIITSFIIDPFDFPLEITETHYKFFPDIGSERINKNDEEMIMEERKKEKIGFFKRKFEKLDEQGLKNKYKEKQNLTIEAQIAIDEIIKERSTN